ncbi:MAG: hypothetical protein KI790_17025 [Cyclobacteriaceae bacterium]|nr:hypothetical protein [Cyclobacteriaceae bacterium HetDA_MAG_MS6]
MRLILTFVTLSCILTTCGPSEQYQAITNYSDYGVYAEAYANNTAQRIESIDQEIIFWTQKLKDTPLGYTYQEKIAKLQQDRFSYSGDIQDLRRAQNSFQELLEFDWRSGLSTNHAILQNHIKLHEFDSAKRKCEVLLRAYPDDLGSKLIYYDILMELGSYDLASKTILKFSTNDSYDCLVRLAKHEDFKGNLASAIELMTQAYQKAQKHSSSSLKAWTATFLAEYLSHSGELRQAYELYLDALSHDPTFLPALQRIIWMAYAADDKVEEACMAMDMINVHSAPTMEPDFAEMLAGIDPAESDQHLKRFYVKAQEPKYTGWYESKIAELEASLFHDFEKAIDLAKSEVIKRPTLQSYDMLAWVYYLKGDLPSAEKTIIHHLEGKTEEPMVLYHMGKIFLARKQEGKSSKYLKKALESSFELGPEITSDIRSIL